MDDRVKVQVGRLLASLHPQPVIVSSVSALSSMPVHRSYSGSTFSFARHLGMRSFRSALSRESRLSVPGSVPCPGCLSTIQHCVYSPLHPIVHASTIQPGSTRCPLQDADGGMYNSIRDG
jgi:hypothetical protein